MLSKTPRKRAPKNMATKRYGPAGPTIKTCPSCGTQHLSQSRVTCSDECLQQFQIERQEEYGDSGYLPSLDEIARLSKEIKIKNGDWCENPNLD